MPKLDADESNVRLKGKMVVSTDHVKKILRYRFEGNIENGSLMAGQSVSLVKKIQTVEEILVGGHNELLINDGAGGFTRVTSGPAVERADGSYGGIAFDATGDGTADDAFSCPDGNWALHADPSSVTCSGSPCTAAECCTVVPPSAAREQFDAALSSAPPSSQWRTS